MSSADGLSIARPARPSDTTVMPSALPLPNRPNPVSSKSFCRRSMCARRYGQPSVPTNSAATSSARRERLNTGGVDGP